MQEDKTGYNQCECDQNRKERVLKMLQPEESYTQGQEADGRQECIQEYSEKSDCKMAERHQGKRQEQDQEGFEEARPESEIRYTLERAKEKDFRPFRMEKNTCIFF